MSEGIKSIEQDSGRAPARPVSELAGGESALEQAKLLRAHLASFEVLRGCGPEILDAVVARCPLRRLDADEPLLVAGQTNREFFIVLAGELRVHLRDRFETWVATLRAGDTAGELSTMDQKPASATVIAHSDAAVLVVDETMFWHIIQASHGFAVRLMLKLAERLRSSNATFQQNLELCAQFEAAALSDALTGVHSRRWLDETLPRLCDRHRFDGMALTIALIDVDHFKRVNDQHGHQVGDLVLNQLARTLRDKLRPTDFVARYGGEEFVAVLPHTPLAGARVAAERLRLAVKASEFKARDGKSLPRVTISIGLAESGPNQDVAALLEHADRCLYRAKHAGRDRVES